MKRAVLFDFHNTLVTCDRWLELEIRTLPGLALERLLCGEASDAHLYEGIKQATEAFQAVREGARRSGREVSAVEGAREVLLSLGLTVPGGGLEEIVRELELECLPEVEIVPGVEAALEGLRDRGYVLGVVSSAGYPPFVELALERIGLRPFFSEVLTSAGEGIYKSDPEIYRRAAARLGAEPGEAVHVGDHPRYDVQAAKAAGLSAVWFMAHSERTTRLHGGSWAEAEEAGLQADAVIREMSELEAAIERLAGD